MTDNRHSTGYLQLDKSLHGGYPSGSVVCLIGNPGVPKELLGLKFLEAKTDMNKSSLLITTKYTLEQTKRVTKNAEISMDDVVVLDAAHWRIKRVNPGLDTSADYEVQNLSDLNAILSTIIQICRTNEGIQRIFFNTPSSLLLYSTPSSEQVFKFFEMLTSFTRSRGITLCFALDDKIHDISIIETFKFLSDGCLTVFNDNSLSVVVDFMILTDFLTGKVQLS